METGAGVIAVLIVLTLLLSFYIIQYSGRSEGFVILSNPWFDKGIDYLPNTGSPFIKIAIKAAIFFIALYVILMLV